MNKTEARKIAKTTLSRGYYRKSDTEFYVFCPTCYPKFRVTIYGWVGSFPTEAKIRAALIAELTEHLTDEDYH